MMVFIIKTVCGEVVYAGDVSTAAGPWFSCYTPLSKGPYYAFKQRGEELPTEQYTDDSKYLVTVFREEGL
jgi:hypothetical protein